MISRFTLSSAALKVLCDFCAANLKSDFDAAVYADSLVSEHENWDGNVIFEIRGFHAAAGNPATISFDCPSDFLYCEVSE
jgi:hypothetical protein